MVTDVLLGSLFTSLAGLIVGITTAVLTDHRENQRWLRTKVYGPLYGELTQVISGEIPENDGEYVSLWADLDYYKTYRVDAALAESLDRYSSDLGRLSGLERTGDFDAFVRALPDWVCDGDGPNAELPSGRTVDMRTWLQRNALVLSTAPSFREEAFGFEPAELDYLWAEVDGVAAGRDTSVDTATALAAMSEEFNWGYESFYDQWDDGWVDELVAAFLAVTERPENTVQASLSLRRAVGEDASDVREMIEFRTDRGMARSLWHEWTG